jgi:CRISPR-associated protein (Cas_csx3)
MRAEEGDSLLRGAVQRERAVHLLPQAALDDRFLFSRIDRALSLPVAMALAHAVAHRFGFVAMRDPKLGKFVVAISHDPAVRPGDLLE